MSAPEIRKYSTEIRLAATMITPVCETSHTGVQDWLLLGETAQRDIGDRNGNQYAASENDDGDKQCGRHKILLKSGRRQIILACSVR